VKNNTKQNIDFKEAELIGGSTKLTLSEHAIRQFRASELNQTVFNIVAIAALETKLAPNRSNDMYLVAQLGGAK
jgi:hypothetical protein